MRKVLRDAGPAVEDPTPAAEQASPEEVAEIEALSIPHDLLLALEGWWRACHHGTREERNGADLVLNHALADHIPAIRAILYPAEKNRD